VPGPSFSAILNQDAHNEIGRTGIAGPVQFMSTRRN
jgi:hypothetical protein